MFLDTLCAQYMTLERCDTILVYVKMYILGPITMGCRSIF